MDQGAPGGGLDGEDGTWSALESRMWTAAGWAATSTQAPPTKVGAGCCSSGQPADKWGVAERHPGKIVWCEFSIA